MKRIVTLILFGISHVACINIIAQTNLVSVSIDFFFLKYTVGLITSISSKFAFNFIVASYVLVT
jgi:hypothetical protein